MKQKTKLRSDFSSSNSTRKIKRELSILLLLLLLSNGASLLSKMKLMPLYRLYKIKIKLKLKTNYNLNEIPNLACSGAFE